jgi:UPF0271 protein
MDINCDLGEGMANEAQIMAYISRCNIATGAHAGSRELILKTMRLAQKNQVAIGAHPSYPDLKNFGRISLDLPHLELKKSLHAQLKLMLECAEICGVSLTHVKPHGALYHDVAQNPDLALLLMNVVKELCQQAAVITAANSVLFDLGDWPQEAIWAESFIDRRYNPDLSLVSRKDPEAIIHDPDHAKEQFLNLCAGQVQTIDGQLLPLNSRTCCIHSDHPNALAIAKAIGSINQE